MVWTIEQTWQSLIRNVASKLKVKLRCVEDKENKLDRYYYPENPEDTFDHVYCRRWETESPSSFDDDQQISTLTDRAESLKHANMP